MRANNLHLKKVNNGTFYKNKLNTLIQGGKKDKKNKVECENSNKLCGQVQRDKQGLSTEPLGKQDRGETDVTLANSPTLSQRRDLMSAKQRIKTVWKVSER